MREAIKGFPVEWWESTVAGCRATNKPIEIIVLSLFVDDFDIDLTIR